MGPGNPGRPRVNKKLLCHETDALLQDIFVRVFKTRYGFDVARESTLEGAGERLATHPFDLLTMSLAFPVGDQADHPHGFGGLTFLRELRDGRYGDPAAKMPVLVISGAENLGKILADSVASLENTWDLNKPFSYKSLDKVVHGILGSSPDPGN